MSLPPRRIVGLLVALPLALAGAALVMPAANAAVAPVPLGTAASYAVLAGSTVTNTGPTTISGDLGVSPGTSVTGFPPGTVSNGTIHAADASAGKAQDDTTTAYTTAAGLTPTGNITADLGGQVLGPGVYSGGALSLTGTLTLDAAGDSSAVFVFQAASSLITASASRVVLIGNASPCNVFWQVTSSATLGVNSVFTGTIAALTAVTADTGATVSGRLLARNAAVTLDSNSVALPVCTAAVVPSPSVTPTATPSATPSPTPSVTPSSTPTARPTPSPSRTPSAVPSPVTTPTSIVTPSPTAPPVVAAEGTAGPPSAPVPGPVPAAPQTPTAPQLPLTGAPTGAAALTGLLIVVFGGLLLLLGRESAPRG